MNPKISVVIPLYNKQEAIESTIHSVLSQTVEPFEIIVVDDGSTDESVSKVCAFKSQKIRLIRKENGGVSSARNVGMSSANGDWIHFLDADDTLESNALEVFCNMINEYPQNNVFIGNYWGNEYAPYRCKAIKSFCKVSDSPYKSFYINYIAPKIGAFIFSKLIINEIGIFDERISFFEDFDFTCRLMDRYSFVFTSLPIMSYRQEFSTLSLPNHPIEREFAFYLKEEHLRNADIWKELVIAENLRYSEYVRSLVGDEKGVTIYRQKYDSLFSWRCHLVIYILDFFKKVKRRWSRLTHNQ